MILDLRAFEEFPVQTEVGVKAGVIEAFSDDVTSVGGMLIRLSVQKSGDEYFCQGTVEGTYEIECSRCLQPYRVAVQQPVDFIICGKDYIAKLRDEATFDNEDYVVFSGQSLSVDLTDQVRQALILSVALKPLCSESCRGLCSVCGENLNERQCDCKTETTDPRWDGLKKLLNEE